jgi:hypothetical protein
MFAENTISSSTVGKYVRMFVDVQKEAGTLIVPQSEGDFSLDNQIAPVLSDEPFISVYQIVQKG